MMLLLTLLNCYCCISVLIGVEGGFDLPEEKYEYDEHVKIVILPEHLDIPQDGLDGLPDMVKDRVSTVIHPGGEKNSHGLIGFALEVELT